MKSKKIHIIGRSMDILHPINDKKEKKKEIDFMRKTT